MHLPPTSDQNKILNSLETIVQCGENSFLSDALVLAQMCFSSLSTKSQHKRVMLFIGSELREGMKYSNAFHCFRY